MTYQPPTPPPVSLTLLPGDAARGPWRTCRCGATHTDGCPVCVGAFRESPEYSRLTRVWAAMDAAALIARLTCGDRL